MRRWMAVAALLALLVGTRVSARTTGVLSYPITEVWSTAVRFIRVDRDYPIKEKDEGSGYILFDMAEGPKTYKGSLELVSTVDPEGRDATRAMFSVPDMPRHYETLLLDKLSAKLKEERGSPAPPPPKKPKDQPPPPKPAPDAGVLPRR